MIGNMSKKDMIEMMEDIFSGFTKEEKKEMMKKMMPKMMGGM